MKHSSLNLAFFLADCGMQIAAHPIIEFHPDIDVPRTATAVGRFLLVIVAHRIEARRA